MSTGRYDLSEPRTKKALQLLQGQIRRRYPSAEFAVTEGEDPGGIYLTAMLDVDEDELDEFFSDERLLDLLEDIQGEQGLPIYVFTRWPPEREHLEIAKQLALKGIPTSP